MWKHASRYMKRKGIPKPGEFDPRNIHGGQLWGTRRECKVTDKMAGEIIERVYESGKVGLDQLKQVRHSLSYAYYLTTGIGGKNYPEVNAQWRSFKLAGLPGVRRPVLPTRIPTPQNLKTAFTTPWTPEHSMPLVLFAPGLLCSWDSQVFGLRPNVDIKKVKNSTVHFINVNEGYGYTEMVGGRSKLHGPKAGTRAWRVYRVCTCNGTHVSPPETIELDEIGNPTTVPVWNTICPLATMEFMRNFQSESWKPYSKWARSTRRYGQNIGDVPTFVNKWLVSQGVAGGPFDRNNGRKCLSRWLELLKVEYREHLHIHGDLEEVWRGHYQTKLLKSGYKVREQSPDADLATAALRRFKDWLRTEDAPEPSIKQKLEAILKGMS